MREKQKGSLTAEASILVSLILFLLMAVIYLLFFFHDRAVMQSYGLRMAEELLWQQEDASGDTLEINVHTPPVFMIKITDISQNVEGILTEILNLAGSRKTAQVRLKGQLPVGISGSAEFTGNTMNVGLSVNMVRVHYVEDRLKAVFLHRQKKGQDELGR